MLRTSTSPIEVVRSTRVHDTRVLTSMPAGKMVPLAAIPLLREDQLNTSRFRLSFEMMETAEILMNAVNVNVKAYLVPNLAFERFNGIDDLNRSYEGIPYEEGQPVVPYIETHEKGAHGAEEIYTYMGKHARPGQQISTAYIEAYNAIWNFRAANRSPDIQKRGRLATDLAPAFWQHPDFNHIVPDFDQAAIDGEVPLNVVSSSLPVFGIYARQNELGNLGSAIPGDFVDGRGNPKDPDSRYSRMWADQPANEMLVLKKEYGMPNVWAEMQQNGITVSLSNLEMARKTQAFAKLRQQYTGHSDEYIIDLLMDGITVPEQAFRQPMLLADQSTIFGMAKRYASDSGNLTESVVSGMTGIDLLLHVPRCATGGIVMIVAEITPEQMFERQMDPYLHTTQVDWLPQYLRDTLDPEKVDVVVNQRIDVDHDTPNGVFGYEPLNARWNHAAPQIGGRFYRPEVDAPFDEDRQRIWAVETQNPTLSTDFYLCTNMHTKPFVVTDQDPFEVVMRGEGVITGNTVFGGHLIEASDDYDQVLAEAPQDRIHKQG